MHPIVKLLVDVLMFVRPIWVAPIVLPLSWIARWIEIIQGGTFEVSLKEHRARVEKLAADVRTAKANGAQRSDTHTHTHTAMRLTRCVALRQVPRGCARTAIRTRRCGSCATSSSPSVASPTPSFRFPCAGQHAHHGQV